MNSNKFGITNNKREKFSRLYELLGAVRYIIIRNYRNHNHRFNKGWKVIITIRNVIEKLEGYSDQNMPVYLGDSEFNKFYAPKNIKKMLITERDIVMDRSGDSNKKIKAIVIEFE